MPIALGRLPRPMSRIVQHNGGPLRCFFGGGNRGGPVVAVVHIRLRVSARQVRLYDSFRNIVIDGFAEQTNDPSGRMVRSPSTAYLARVSRVPFANALDQHVRTEISGSRSHKSVI